MTLPAALPSETIFRGTLFEPRYLLQDAAGVALDLTLSQTVVTLRMLAEDGSTLVMRSTANVGESSWVTNGTDGKIQFNFAIAGTLALALGQHSVEIVYSQGGTTKTLHARGTWRVEDPVTGAI